MGSDRPLSILLHGWLGDVADFEPLREHLPGAVALPLPGHGGLPLDADSDTDPVLAALARDIGKTADGRPFVLCGYSMGGRLAMWLTARGLLAPRGLVLIAASPGIADERERAARLAAEATPAGRLRNGDFGAFLDRWYAQPLFGGLAGSPRFGQLRARRLRRDREQVARALEMLGVGRQPDLTRHAFGAKTLYIAGERDRKYSAIAAGWTQGEAKILPAAGHAVHLEQPALLARRIMEMEWNR